MVTFSTQETVDNIYLIYSDVVKTNMDLIHPKAKRQTYIGSLSIMSGHLYYRHRAERVRDSEIEY